MPDPHIPIHELSDEELQALAASIPLEIEQLREYGKKGQTSEYWSEVSLFSRVVEELSQRRREKEKDKIPKACK